MVCEQHAHVVCSEYACVNSGLPEFRPATGIFREVAPILLRLGTVVNVGIGGGMAASDFGINGVDGNGD